MADEKTIIIIGGGLAGMSCGVYALRSGYRVTIIEHNIALGGVCTSWKRGPYMVDGCIHWLTGGPFMRVYEELGIVRQVGMRTLDTWNTYRDVSRGIEVPFTRDLSKLFGLLREIAPLDADELARMQQGAFDAVRMEPPLKPHELMTPRDGFQMAWAMRGSLSTLVHFRKPIGEWARDHLKSPTLQRLFLSLFPETAPALFLLMVLGYLERGYLSRPVGGTAAFRDALEHTYRSLGGEVMLHATVDEVMVTNDRVTGVRLSDGTEQEADIVVSTASAPETVLRLLGGRYDAKATRERMTTWKLFDPIVLASFGVAQAYKDQPGLLVLDGLSPSTIGGRTEQRLYIRVCNDDPSFAPVGHSVVQAMVPTDYDYWAKRGAHYSADKDAVAEALIDRLARHFPALPESVRMRDIATPLTYWSMARSWRGAYEGWMPSGASLMSSLDKKLPGLAGFYMAGQWVEPGGGVPTATLSGRQAAQLICSDDQRPFVVT